MRKFVVLALAAVACALVSVPSESQTPSHACFSDCSSCVVRCRKADDRASCERTCREIKRSCCRSAGKGPGPLVTCGCT